MQAPAAISIGVLIMAALACDTGRLIAPRENRCPPVARLRDRRGLEAAERRRAGLRTHGGIDAPDHQRRMSGEVAHRFGDQWDTYAARTPAFWPRRPRRTSAGPEAAQAR
ncbi:hypothetical protein [Streptomyces sp. NBC_00140]|uniref:hypothetical protein n=1 Tax=Streptomyces sp. NBC_00140 TaxID=2975664 RepID=UPI0022518E98|nr:hypothetical protein [Streptomyces sp. NBC_00140]MCX5336713.1 hypothetical protein [Streptomyces sp. NBC_00140]